MGCRGTELDVDDADIGDADEDGDDDGVVGSL